MITYITELCVCASVCVCGWGGGGRGGGGGSLASFPVSPLQFLRHLQYCKRRKNWSGETGNEARGALIVSVPLPK